MHVTFVSIFSLRDEGEVDHPDGEDEANGHNCPEPQEGDGEGGSGGQEDHQRKEVKDGLEHLAPVDWDLI